MVNPTVASWYTIEQLQQKVSSGSLSITAACNKVEELVQNWCKDELTRPFLGALPRLLSLLLGDERQAGWLEKAWEERTMEALWNLLRPEGVLFRAASVHGGEGETLTNSCFDVACAIYLPVIGFCLVEMKRFMVL